MTFTERMRGPWRTRYFIAGYLSNVGVCAYLLYVMYSNSSQMPHAAAWIPVGTVAILGIFYVYVSFIGLPSGWFDLISFLSGAIMLMLAFADIYEKSPAGTFSRDHLSFVDAIYVALGTLSTAGTGDITPRSQFGHGVLVAQMLVDLTVVTFGVGRAYSRFKEARATAP